MPEENENKQLEVLISYMNRYFNPQRWDTYLVINPKFPDVPKQFALLVYRNNKFAFIELKNLKRKFYLNIDY